MNFVRHLFTEQEMPDLSTIDALRKKYRPDVNAKVFNAQQRNEQKKSSKKVQKKAFSKQKKGDKGRDPKKPEDPNDRKINVVGKAAFFKLVKDQYEHWKDGIYKLKDRVTGLINGKAHYLKWDHLHNDVEVWTKSETHLGSIDPITLKLYKGPQGHRMF